MQENIKEKDENVAVYEVSFLLLPSLASEQVPSSADFLKKVIKELGGAIISDENPILIDLAYPMTKVVGTTRHKVDTAYFGWLKFELSRDGMEKVKKSLDSSENVLRYLIIKTVRENTLLFGKMKLGKEEKPKRNEEKDEPVEDDSIDVVKETSPEEIDKSIDELVIA